MLAMILSSATTAKAEDEQDRGLAAEDAVSRIPLTREDLRVRSGGASSLSLETDEQYDDALSELRLFAVAHIWFRVELVEDQLPALAGLLADGMSFMELTVQPSPQGGTELLAPGLVKGLAGDQLTHRHYFANYLRYNSLQGGLDSLTIEAEGLNFTLAKESYIELTPSDHYEVSLEAPIRVVAPLGEETQFRVKADQRGARPEMGRVDLSVNSQGDASSIAVDAAVGEPNSWVISLKGGATGSTLLLSLSGAYNTPTRPVTVTPTPPPSLVDSLVLPGLALLLPLLVAGLLLLRRALPQVEWLRIR